MPAEAAALALMLAAAGTPPVPAQAPEAPPSVELLEFIGGFVADDGEWVDPEMLARQPELAAGVRQEAEDDGR